MNIVEQIENMFRAGWIIPQKPAFNAASFPARCKYAAWAICADNHDRKADTCFEMYDGAAVVAALMRAAQGGKADYLLHCIKGQFATEHGFKKWQETANKNAFWDDDQLPAFAKCEREEGRALSRAAISGQQTADQLALF